ncbi:MAG: hypothetical protein ACPGGK_17380 [Pikeienuella sp.]
MLRSVAIILALTAGGAFAESLKQSDVKAIQAAEKQMLVSPVVVPLSGGRFDVSFVMTMKTEGLRDFAMQAAGSHLPFGVGNCVAASYAQTNGATQVALIGGGSKGVAADGWLPMDANLEYSTVNTPIGGSFDVEQKLGECVGLSMSSDYKIQKAGTE